MEFGNVRSGLYAFVRVSSRCFIGVSLERQMSRQTTECVYLISEVGSDRVKIGYATNVSARLHTLQTGNPRKLRLSMSFASGRDIERALHEAFKASAVGLEWFDDQHGIIRRVFETFAEAAAWGDEITPADIALEASWATKMEAYGLATGDWNLEAPDVPAEVLAGGYSPA